MTRSFWLGLILLSAAAAARAQDAAADPAASASETPPAIEKFDRVYAQWQEIARKLAQLETVYNNSNDLQRMKIRGEYSRALDESNVLLARLIPALADGYKAKRKDRRLSDLIGVLGPLTYDGDRYEYTLQLTEPLMDDFGNQPSVFDLAGRAATQIGRFDDAQRWLTRALELKGLQPEGEQMLETMSQRRSRWETELSRAQEERKRDDLPRVKLETTRGDIVIELFEDDVPNTVASFVSLVSDEFYDGLEFFRVAIGFGAFAGSPRNDGVGGPGYETLKETGPRGDRPHLRGYVSMIPLGERTNGSQFFITLRPTACERLDGRQTVFGRIVEGLDVAERLHRVDTRGRSILETDKIVKATMTRQREHQYTPVTTADLAQQQMIAGLRFYAQKNYAEAERMFREGLALFPNHHSLHFNLGAALISQGKVDEGKQELEETLRLNTKHARAHYFMAVLLLREKKTDDAVAHLKSARRIDPTFEPAQELLKQVLGQTKSS